MPCALHDGGGGNQRCLRGLHGDLHVQHHHTVTNNVIQITSTLTLGILKLWTTWHMTHNWTDTMRNCRYSTQDCRLPLDNINDRSYVPHWETLLWPGITAAQYIIVNWRTDDFVHILLQSSDWQHSFFSILSFCRAAVPQFCHYVIKTFSPPPASLYSIRG